MTGGNKNGQPGARSTAKPEIRLKARAVSRGTAVGKAVWLYGNSRQFPRVTISEKHVGRELKRLQKAFERAKSQLKKLASGNGSSAAGSGIFEAHLVILDDGGFVEKIGNEIESHRVNTEWAIKQIADVYISRYRSIEDETLRSRYIDIEDVADRLLACLAGTEQLKLPHAKNAVIIARELLPSTLVELEKISPKAIVTQDGGWTSHAFIIAREMRLPAVTGIRNLMRRIGPDDTIVVDGFAGRVIINPEDATLAEYSTGNAVVTSSGVAPPERTAPTKTLDGLQIKIYANADAPETVRKSLSLGAAGVGLFRSEHLFDLHRGFPTEAQQFSAYTAMADSAGEGRVKMRTFDIGTNRLPGEGLTREKNPALGLRAVRLGLRHERELRIQLRALIRAAKKGNLDILIPMASGLSEIRKVRSLIAEEADRLRVKKLPFGAPLLGVMIEVPSAALLADEILEECDFACLGTNDLIQYLLAVDRDNESVADWYRTLHPAVLTTVGNVIEAARRREKSLIICGEMAGSPYYVPILIGLGATELSMNVSSMPRITALIETIAAEECRKLVATIKALSTAEEIEAEVASFIRKNWKNLYPEDFSLS